jgi:predicted acylesterase/phospholipase RssA
MVSSGFSMTGRIALCLCGGGITGAVYELGALMALSEMFVDFDTSRFDMYLGTSAGAFVAALMCAGRRPAELARSILQPKAQDRVLPSHSSDIYHVDLKHLSRVVIDVGKILARAAGRAAREREWNSREVALDLEDALPPGLFTLDRYESWITETFGLHGIPTSFGAMPHELYITANDLDSGHRVVFGTPEAGAVSIPRAICASSAIPLFFAPVEIGGRDFVDGAVGKVSHLDVLLARGAELVVVINPMIPVRTGGGALPSALLGATRMRDKGLIAVFEQCRRMNVRTKLYQGLRRYRLQYPDATILLIEPQEDEADMMLSNPMNFAARRRVLRYGFDSAARQLTARSQEFAAACAAHGITLDASRLARRPWNEAR